VVDVPTMVSESPKQPPRLPDQAHWPHGHQPEQHAASLVPGLPKPMCHCTSYRCGPP
ncbi:hypothetical protein Tco_1331421, partial [Tanacetum coccineum]